MGGGVVDHLLAVSAKPLLAGAAALRRPAQSRQPVDQGVARPLQVLDRGQPTDRDRRLHVPSGVGPAIVPGVGGELGLEPRDLAAQLAAEDRRAGLGVELRQRRGWQRRTHPGRPGRPDALRELVAFDPEVAGPLERSSDEGVERRGIRPRRGDVGSTAVLGRDRPLVLERYVDGAGGVHVDPGESGELADAGQTIAGAQGPAGDHRPQLPDELSADRYLGVSLGGEVDHRGSLQLVARERNVGKRDACVRERVCHLNDTVALQES